MSLFGKITAVLVVLTASLFGLHVLSANCAASGGCCCGETCACESCDCDGESCSNCECEGCDCDACECGGSCPVDAA